MMMMLVYCMWQNIWILFFPTEINELTIISMKMYHIIFILKIWILRVTLSQNLLFALLWTSTFANVAISLPKEVIHIVEIALALRILNLLCMLS